MNIDSGSTPFCLVLMPFGSGSDDVYTLEIRPAIENAGFRAQRLEEFASTDLLVSVIWRAIKEAQVIVADLSGKNPNVFYELGLAHALGKPALILTQSLKDVPWKLWELQ